MHKFLDHLLNKQKLYSILFAIVLFLVLFLSSVPLWLLERGLKSKLDEFGVEVLESQGSISQGQMNLRKDGRRIGLDWDYCPFASLHPLGVCFNVASRDYGNYELKWIPSLSLLYLKNIRSRLSYEIIEKIAPQAGIIFSDGTISLNLQFVRFDPQSKMVLDWLGTGKLEKVGTSFVRETLQGDLKFGLQEGSNLPLILATAEINEVAKFEANILQQQLDGGNKQLLIQGQVQLPENSKYKQIFSRFLQPNPQDGNVFLLDTSIPF